MELVIVSMYYQSGYWMSTQLYMMTSQIMQFPGHWTSVLAFQIPLLQLDLLMFLCNITVCLWNTISRGWKYSLFIVWAAIIRANLQLWQHGSMSWLFNVAILLISRAIFLQVLNSRSDKLDCMQKSDSTLWFDPISKYHLIMADISNWSSV